jgi:putative membrane protein
MMYWGHGMSGWGYLAMALSTVAFWGVLITGIVLLARYLGGGYRASRPPTTVDPQQILAERFARGEIDEQEYHSRLATLRGTGHAASDEHMRL